MPRKLVGVLSTSGRVGPRGPEGPQGPPGQSVIPDNVLSIERVGDYLYRITFNNIPEYIPANDLVIGGCSSYVKEGLLYRNFDWNYSETASFIVKTKDFEGMASIDGLNDGELNTERLAQLPYHLSDGVNKYGIRVSEHVLFNDFDYEYIGNNPIQTLPYFILQNIKSLDEIEELEDWLEDVQIPVQLSAQEYLLQFLVTDGTRTLYIGPSDTGYEIIDISSNPKLTNFKWVDRETVSRTDSDIQLRPTGIERWNLINGENTLEDLEFTKAYKNPNRLSEFIGLRETTKESTDEELLEIYTIAHQMYLERTRNSETWQTVHSVVYSENGIQTLNVQENYSKDYGIVDKNTVVTTFNARQGNVQPEFGDYNLQMVGAEILTNTEIDELWRSI